MRLEGQLALAPVEIYLSDTTASEIPQLDIIEINLDKEQTGKMKELAIPAAEEGMGKISFDIQATLPNRVFIRGRGLESEYKGILHVAGHSDALTITGSLAVVRGYVDFLDRRFKVVEGSLTFHGYQPPSPVLNLTADYKTSALRAILRLTGDVSAPKIALESDPPLPEDEILSRLLFGKGLENITPWQAFRLAQALKTLSGGQGFNVLGSVRQALKVDQLEVMQGDEDQVAIGVGKYVSDEVFVDVQKQVQGEGGKVSVEVQVTPNIAVESEVGTDSKADIGLNWGFSY
jgi:translocation and assembly module TamB